MTAEVCLPFLPLPAGEGRGEGSLPGWSNDHGLRLPLSIHDDRFRLHVPPPASLHLCGHAWDNGNLDSRLRGNDSGAWHLTGLWSPGPLCHSHTLASLSFLQLGPSVIPAGLSGNPVLPLFALSPCGRGPG